MSHQSSQSVDRRGFHFEIGDAVLSVLKIGKAVYQVWIAEAKAQDTTLRAIESGTGYGDALMKIVDKMLEQTGGGAVDVGGTDLGVDLGVGDEGLQEQLLFAVLFVAVKVKQVVDAQAVRGRYEAIYRNVCLQRAGGADADDLQGLQIGFDLAGFQIDVDQCIQLVHHDVDVVGSYPRGEDRDPLVADPPGMADELPVLLFVLDRIEILTDLGHAVGIAYGDDGGGQLFGAKIQVVYGSSFIEDQFGFGDLRHA